MNDDLELERWRSLWQTEVGIPAQLRERAKAQLRRSRMMLIADVIVTILIGGGLTVWALANKQNSFTVLTCWVWIMIIAAWLFRFNNPDNWTGAAPNTEVFLEELRGSYRASLRNLKFGWLLGVLFLWFQREMSRHGLLTVVQFPSLKMKLLVWSSVAVVFAWSAWLFRKLKRELAALETLQSDWEHPESIFQGDTRPHSVRNPGLVSRLAQYVDLFQSHVDGLDWALRRKKRISSSLKEKI